MPDLFGPLLSEVPGRTIKALSVRQPWTFAILYLGKPVENRSWPTKLRGRVLLHAGKVQPDESDIDSVGDLGRAAIAALADEAADFGEPFSLSAMNFDLGGIVGSVEIVDCVTSLPSPWFFGPYGFVLRNPRPLPFTPLRGQLGFFDVPADIVRGLDF